MCITNLTSLTWLYLVLIPLSFLAFLHLILRPKPAKIRSENRYVFITGASRGIGLALAQLCAKSGARVSILDRNMAKLQEAKKSIRLATGIDVAVFMADVRDPDAVNTVLDEAGPVDVLVCKPGVFVPREGLTKEEFMVDVPLIGTSNLVRAALPAMKGQGERGPWSIAIMSSEYSYMSPVLSHYGLKRLAEELQQEVIGDYIHVSLIFPPDTETYRFAQALGAMKVAKKALVRIQSGSFKITFEGVFKYKPTMLQHFLAKLPPNLSRRLQHNPNHTTKMVQMDGNQIWVKTIHNFQTSNS